ncbi:hypothetical protein D3C86_954560 [compost metagenome]
MAAAASMYPVEIHSMSSTLEPKAAMMCGSATLTMLESMMTMNMPMMTGRAAHHM